MMSHRKEFKFAFVHTTPVLFSYIFLGMAFGIMMQEAGYGPIWSFSCSTFIYTGAFQMALVGFLKSAAPILTICFTALAMGSRHFFYGLSFIEDFKKMGKKGIFMIFSLTDESYALYCSLDIPKELDRDRTRFFIGFLCWCYWIVGSTLGGIIGSVIPFDFAGIDFCMTALFVCIFLDQWKKEKNHLHALSGIGFSILFLLLVGKDNFILPALILSTGMILIGAPKGKQGKRKEEEVL
ncbi:MAG: AzlC family ABC transporter permease [Agathobacter sp.]